MDTIVIPDVGEVLFEADLEAQEKESSLTKGAGPIESDLTFLGGKHNRIAIGRPFSQRLTTKSKQVTPEVKHLMETNDFYLLSLSCSFLPDAGCKFRWAQLGVMLQGMGADGSPAPDKPIAWNLFPVEVVSAVTYTSGLAISPELGFKSGGGEADVKIFSLSSEKKWISYQPQLFAFGYRTSNIAWQFRETSEKDVRGDVRDLIIQNLTWGLSHGVRSLDSRKRWTTGWEANKLWLEMASPGSSGLF
jgi:hypothetical protein